MAATISPAFEPHERDGVEKALAIADLELDFIERLLADLMQQRTTHEPLDWTMQDYLRLLRAAFQIDVNPWGVESADRHRVNTVRTVYNQAKQILGYNNTRFTRIEENSGTAAQAINPVPTSFINILMAGRKLEIQINVTTFFGSLISNPFKYDVDDWRRYAPDGDFARATYLVHEAIHHVVGGAAAGESGHFCSASGKAVHDPYSYQRFMVARKALNYIPISALEPAIFAPPSTEKCAALNSRNHLPTATGVLGGARQAGSLGLYA